MKDNASENEDGAHLLNALWRTYRVLLARSEGVKRSLELCDSDFRVLEVLLHRGPQPVNVLGEIVDLTTGSITSAIDRLEQRWLAVRKNHLNDRRVRVVELTSKGRKLIEKAYAQHRLDMNAAVSQLSRQDRLSLLNLLSRLEGGDEGSNRVQSVGQQRYQAGKQ